MLTKYKLNPRLFLREQYKDYWINTTFIDNRLTMGFKLDSRVNMALLPTKTNFDLEIKPKDNGYYIRAYLENETQFNIFLNQVVKHIESFILIT